MGRPTTFPAEVVGIVYGSRRILAEVEPAGRNTHRRVRWLCSCGRTGETTLNCVARSKACRSCAYGFRDQSGPRRQIVARHHNRPELVALLDEAGARAPEVWDGDTEASIEAITELVGLVGTFRLCEIGALFGVSRERIRQIETKALGRLAKRAKLAHIELPSERPPSTQDLLELEAWGGEAA